MSGHQNYCVPLWRWLNECDKLLFVRLKQDQSVDVLNALLFLITFCSSLYLPLPLTQGFFVSVFYCFLNSEVSRFTSAYWSHILCSPCFTLLFIIPLSWRSHSPFWWLLLCAIAGNWVIKLEALIFRAQLRLVMYRRKWHHFLRFLTVSDLIWFHGEIGGETLSK